MLVRFFFVWRQDPLPSCCCLHPSTSCYLLWRFPSKNSYLLFFFVWFEKKRARPPLIWRTGQSQWGVHTASNNLHTSQERKKKSESTLTECLICCYFTWRRPRMTDGHWLVLFIGNSIIVQDVYFCYLASKRLLPVQFYFWNGRKKVGPAMSQHTGTVDSRKRKEAAGNNVALGLR